MIKNNTGARDDDRTVEGRKRRRNDILTLHSSFLLHIFDSTFFFSVLRTIVNAIRRLIAEAPEKMRAQQ